MSAQLPFSEALTDRFIADVAGHLPALPSEISERIGEKLVRVIAALHVLVGRALAVVTRDGRYVSIENVASLLASGALSAPEIASRLGIIDTDARLFLRLLRGQQRIVETGGAWGLAAPDDSVAFAASRAAGMAAFCQLREGR